MRWLWQGKLRYYLHEYSTIIIQNKNFSGKLLRALQVHRELRKASGCESTQVENTVD